MLKQLVKILTLASSHSTLPDDGDNHTPKHVGAIVILM